MLRKCCYCIELRKACIVISIIDFIFNLAILNLKSKPPIGRAERAVAICHCIGCFFLLGGGLLKATVLLIFFLITSLTNSFILTLYSIYLCVTEAKTRVTVISVCSVYVCKLLAIDIPLESIHLNHSSGVEIYFWIVVYSYYTQVRRANNVEDD
ncbi:hypothetical protein KR054_008498 [Drosophila jambulina]|nr:hypothetical protein KR054_008498 [Drosophila jambulina]